MTDALDKIKKLLALSESNNEHEAALAAERAQDLMLKHGISMVEVAAAQGNDRISAEGDALTAKTDSWRKSLATIVAKSMGGQAVIGLNERAMDGSKQRKAKFYFYGASGTVPAMIQLYTYLETELTRISAVQTAQRVETWIHGKTYRTSFLFGAIARLQKRFDEKQRQIESETDSSMALVVVKNAVDEKVNEEHPHRQSEAVGAPRSYEGYSAGHKAAGSISLGEQQLSSRRLLTS